MRRQHFKIMKTIIISPTNKASGRTKNRIREHGPVFEVVGTDDTLGGEQLLVRERFSQSGSTWLGWLPRDEFHIKRVDEKFIKKALDK